MRHSSEGGKKFNAAGPMEVWSSTGTEIEKEGGPPHGGPPAKNN